MIGRVGTKSYDTDKATLIDTLPDGIQVYRKKGRSTEFYLYNPNGSTAKERFFDLPPEDALKYIPENTKSKNAPRGSSQIQFRPYDLERIRNLALKNGMAMNNFVMMLVDEYERKQDE